MGKVFIQGAYHWGNWTKVRLNYGIICYAMKKIESIHSSPQRKMTLNEIYDWIVQNIDFFKGEGATNSSGKWRCDTCDTFISLVIKTYSAGWKNSIRHNLSLHAIFVKEPQVCQVIVNLETLMFPSSPLPYFILSYLFLIFSKMELDQLGAIGDLIVLVSQTKKKVENDNEKELFDDEQTRTSLKLAMRRLGYVHVNKLCVGCMRLWCLEQNRMSRWMSIL